MNELESLFIVLAGVVFQYDKEVQQVFMSDVAAEQTVSVLCYHLPELIEFLQAVSDDHKAPEIKQKDKMRLDAWNEAMA